MRTLASALSTMRTAGAPQRVAVLGHPPHWLGRRLSPLQEVDQATSLAKQGVDQVFLCPDWLAAGGDACDAVRLVRAGNASLRVRSVVRDDVADVLARLFLAGEPGLVAPLGPHGIGGSQRIPSRRVVRFSDDPTVAEALTLLAESSFSLSIGDVAECVGLSERTLERRFHAALRMRPSDVVQLNRLAVAEHLLSAGIATRAIARAVGFGNASAFCAAFRRATGTRPRQRAQQLLAGGGESLES